ncbi:Bromodomain-containing protein [Venustampulla echinocandica]|uniref:SAGA complex subunit Spt7 n=1 Tax=Venustampulla echinocandica TaxID=2656787 RepID=A0A370TCC3_9HELO|nr:Bromodomain-containing protein [Venustampulla echinocandica]RDL31876.1 Bromodomain-containing protein [Venustampulla echinocandica]
MSSRSGPSAAGPAISITNGAHGHHTWLPPSSHLSSKPFNHRDETPARSNTPSLLFDDATMAEPAAVQYDGDRDNAEEEHQKALFKELYRRSEARIADLFGGNKFAEGRGSAEDASAHHDQLAEQPSTAELPKAQTPKKSARTIDEDNYDDDDDDEEEDIRASTQIKDKSANALLSPSKSGSSPVSSDLSPTKQTEGPKDEAAQEPRSSEDARKQLEEEKKATEEAAKRSFHTLFYTLENDRVAMLEQQKLEEAEKQINAEMDHSGNANNTSGGAGEHHGSLSSANLGASSLTLKHLIARIDLKREKVKASDAELRALMNEVRKNRSKWASEENVHQEELYEAAEKVLSELKAMTEYSAPFLTRVNKREAPDYYNIIKHPMDLGTMTKKLKTLTYKSKAEFVADLDLIWGNCLKYNADIGHALRRNANSMRKEAEKLVPLIPDLVIRPRAEVEAEERRKQNGGEDDAGDDSDDEPIMSSRGRKAGAKGSTKARKSGPGKDEGTPGIDQKPALQVNGVLNGLGHDGSETGFDGSNGFATPPLGSITPGGINGVPGLGSQADGMDTDGPSINEMSLGQALGAAAEDIREDEEYKIWKQVTKKDRALVAKERNRLFKGDRLNPDEPALVRTKAGMRRWLRHQKQAQADVSQADVGKDGKESAQATETLAEGMEGEEERVLPDYYDPLSAIPDIPPRHQWIEDSEGQVIDQSEEFLRMVKPGHFTAPKSFLTSKIEANMRQMQETRKLCSKIGVIKQMQIQAQMYNNQFPKYEPEPFVEADIEPHVTSDDGPVMATWVCRATMQRSVAELCYHAGFEELQPSALDVITDIAGDFFTKIARTVNVYREAPKVPATGAVAEAGKKWQEHFTDEEVLLHTLSENGMDVESLESYVKDDVERLGTKLGVMHERMKAHLSDLLRPALTDGGADGSGAFNDGSEQFVGGDFAEELGEDFFGFKALGLDSEFGMSSLSVPLHLLHAKIHRSYPGPTASAPTAEIFPPLPPPEPVTKENLQEQIGLVRNFFLAKLHANDDEPLLEDEELPPKQRPSRPRLGPTGKITSPRKRPLKEQSGNSKKKKKLDNGTAMDPTTGTKSGINGSPEKGNALTASAKKLKLGLPNGGPVSMERTESQSNMSQTEKDDASAIGMMSPESIER